MAMNLIALYILHYIPGNYDGSLSVEEAADMNLIGLNMSILSKFI